MPSGKASGFDCQAYREAGRDVLAARPAALLAAGLLSSGAGGLGGLAYCDADVVTLGDVESGRGSARDHGGSDEEGGEDVLHFFCFWRVGV